MCGILGISAPGRIEAGVLSSALRALRHRGPDDEGTFQNEAGTLSLAHARLSVIDLSAAGHQPMANEEETVRIIFNGEIYNFQALREELLAKGHRFRSRTDTEVILHLYEEEGEQAVSRLTGMFAFAIYDQRTQQLFLARDRLGIKPLYYAQHHGTFLFASEIKGLLATGLVPAVPDWQAIWDYFTYQFVPHPLTAFEGIRQLPPAHTLRLDLKSGQLTKTRYWTPWSAGDLGKVPDYEELRQQVRDRVTEAVRSELVSDVPLGLFFSGGIDSTVLAALMKQAGGKVKTFTVFFEEAARAELRLFDDRPYARLASRLIGTEHHELPVQLPRNDQFLEMVGLVDQPFGNPTLYLQYLIAKATRREATVVLSGVGADELFGGYPKYRLLPFASALRGIPVPLGQAGRSLLGLFREDLFGSALRRGKRLLKGAGLPLPEQYLGWSYGLTEENKRRLLLCPGKELRASVWAVRDAMALAPEGAGDQQKFLAAELETFLADNLLEYTDKATMAVALETRVPFLDHRLVELGSRLPFHAKIHRGRMKRILLDAFKDMIPEPIAQAPKRGFGPPIAEWMDAGLDRYFDEMLTPERVRKEGIFRWEALREMRAAHRSGKRDTSMELTSVMMFDAWYRRYILP